MSDNAKVARLAERLKQLAYAIADGRMGEFTMRVPAEPERDADLVLIDAASTLSDFRSSLSCCEEERRLQGEEIRKLQAEVEQLHIRLRNSEIGRAQLHDLIVNGKSDDLRTALQALEFQQQAEAALAGVQERNKELESEVARLQDKALAYDLDQAGIARRDAEALELVAMSQESMLDRHARTSEQQTAIREFFEFLAERGLHLAEWNDRGTCLYPSQASIARLIEEFYEIDAAALERERRELLSSARKP